MKTITISDETYEFLKECQLELKTQNNRSTKDPMFCIMDIKKVGSMESGYEDDYEWVDLDSDYITVGKDKDLFDYLMSQDTDDNSNENYSCIVCYLEDCNDKNYEFVDNEEIKKNFCDCINYSDDLEFMDLGSRIKRIRYKNIHKLEEGSVFSFFEKDAGEHLKANDYHYTNGAYTYTCSLWRSPRMEKLRNILLTGLELKDE